MNLDPAKPGGRIDAIKRRAYGVAFGIASIACFAEFAVSSAGESAGFRYLFGPVIGVLCVLLGLVFVTGETPVRTLEKLAVGVSWSFIVLRAVSVLVTASGTGFSPGHSPNFGIWMAPGFLFTFVAIRTKVALRVTLAFYGLIVASGVAFLVARGSAVTAFEVNTVIQQLVVANGFTLSFVYFLSRTKEELARERTERRLMARLAHTDDLTNLPNRRFILQSLLRAVMRADRDGSTLSVILFDLDHFKAVNDTHGHATGDAVLLRAATLARELLRVSDEIGRFGGEEFLIVAFDADLDAAAGLAERLRLGFEQFESESEPRFTASFGVATHRRDEPLTALISRADDALYAAKSRGRNRVVRDTDLAGRPAPESAPGGPLGGRASGEE